MSPAPNAASHAAAEHVFSWPVRVYYEDTDTGGIVFYANYLKFFERARTEWLRAAGVGQQSLAETEGIMFVVRSTAVDYHAPARLDDVLRITVGVEKLGRASVSFYQEAWTERNGTPQLLASGTIRVGCLAMNAFRPAPLPQTVHESLARAHAKR